MIAYIYKIGYNIFDFMIKCGWWDIMENVKKMSDFFGGAEDVFNPPFSYEGNYGFPVETLYGCSKLDGKRNLVKDYLKKEFIDKVENLLGSEYTSVIPKYYLESDVQVNGKGRKLQLSLMAITYNICYALVQDAPNFEQVENDFTKYKDILVAFFKKYKVAISKVRSGKVSEEYKDMQVKLENLYISYEETMKHNLKSSFRPVSFDNYLGKLYDYIVRFLVRYNKLVEICNKPIDLEKLNGCLDLERFYFVMCCILLQNSKASEEIEGKLHNSFNFVSQYMKNLEALSDDYNVVMNVVGADGKVVAVDIGGLKGEFYRLRNRHPEYKTFVIAADPSKDYRDINIANGVVEEVEKAKLAKELQAAWDFIPHGKSERNNLDTGDKKVLSENYSKEELEQYEKDKKLRERIDFFENSPYLYRLEGKNTFKGYIGYIYSNGYVVFEKFYKSDDSFDLAEGATYVMGVTNFLEMSKKTKPEIIEYIKSGKTDVMRKYHVASWSRNMMQVIAGKGYDKETMDVIENLVKMGSIEKKEGVK